MRPELDQQLCEKYPLIFKQRRMGMRDTAMCWGFEHGDGWFHLIDTLCAMLYAPYRSAERDYLYAREHEGTAPYKGAEVITAVEVERKRLAMKAAADAIPQAVQVKEKFGTLRFYVNGGTPEQHNYIDFAEEMSGRVCEHCGAPGKRRGGGWVRTLCDEHEAQHQAGKLRG